MLQRTCFALPVVLSVPATVAVLLVMCRKRYIDPCHLTNFFPKELFWRCNTAKNLLEFFPLAIDTNLVCYFNGTIMDNIASLEATSRKTC
ncbi:hypothetical protein WUBG_16436 [Wuchereria bancrofti]|uniref:Uncharacterized protein n=1 Tax=Wuchereria bancrofti TaxID=6293 RepID=J9EB98_WUCBA|nr:hypothetical protein WUBG_16436 [Wuchereria bancrofti]